MENRKIAFITGAGSGFGLETTLALAKQQYMVIATVRSLERVYSLKERMEKAQIASHVEIMQLDVTNDAELKRVIAKVKSKYKRIDLLINNAGFAMAGFAEELSIDEWKEQFNTNVFGLIAVTRAILPMMRHQRAGKIINISSISGKVPFPGLGAYCASKHAIEAFNESLRMEVKAFGIHVSSILPGSFQTNIWTKGKKMAKLSGAPNSPYLNQLKKIEQYIEQGKPSFGDGKEVAALIVKVARSPAPKARYYIGKHVRLSLLLYRVIPNKIWERLVTTRL